MTSADSAEVIGCDVLLSRLIYVLVKANIPDMPVYLSIIGYFTLEHRQQDFEYMNTTLQAAIMFIRQELCRLSDPTLHYTYIDGKSYLGSRFERPIS